MATPEELKNPPVAAGLPNKNFQFSTPGVYSEAKKDVAATPPGIEKGAMRIRGALATGAALGRDLLGATYHYAGEPVVEGVGKFGKTLLTGETSQQPAQPAQTPAVPPVAPTAPTAPVTPTTNPTTSPVAPLTGDKIYDKANGIAEYVGKNGERAFSNIRPEDRDKGGNFTVMDSSGLRASPYYKQALAEQSGQGLPQAAPQNQITVIGENGGFGFDKPDPAKQRIQAIDMAAKDMAAKAGIGAPTPGMVKAAIAMHQSHDDLTNANTVASTSRANKQDDMTLGREGLTSEEDRAQAKAITDMRLRQDANANALDVAELGGTAKLRAAEIAAGKGLPSKPVNVYDDQTQALVTRWPITRSDGMTEYVDQATYNKLMGAKANETK